MSDNIKKIGGRDIERIYHGDKGSVVVIEPKDGDIRISEKSRTDARAGPKIREGSEATYEMDSSGDLHAYNTESSEIKIEVAG